MNDLHLNRWILFSQLTLLVLVAALAWQGISAARSQERLVRELLGDYAQLITENAERSINSNLGYRTLYALVDSFQRQPELFPLDRAWNKNIFKASMSLPVSSGQIKAVAVRDAGMESVQVLWLDGNTREESLRELVSSLASALAAPEPFKVRHPLLDGVTQTVVLATVPDGEGRAIIWVDPLVINEKFRFLMANAILLPRALGNPERLRPNIYLSLSDPSGTEVFSTAFSPRGEQMGRHTIGGDYSGLLEGFEIRASINPSIAAELVIGGLPYGRLPFILALVLVASLLAALGAFLMHRQRDIHALRDDFIARVSHELRTPLTQIRMYAESLIHGRIAKSEERDEALAVINREAMRLGNMVDSILRFEDPRTNPPAIEGNAYSLFTWAVDLVADFQPLLDADAVSVMKSIPGNVITRCNRDALTQIAGNLLDNSLKYGPPGQVIEISYLAGKDHWKLLFGDGGPGIRASQSELIFEAYQRLQRDRDNGTTGTGIGLSVARDLARSMGGELAVEGELENSVFVLTISEQRIAASGDADD